MNLSDLYWLGFSALQFGFCVYLLRQNQILVNKLMSRNYGEYATTENFLAKKPEVETPEVADAYDEQRSREINGIMGMGS